MNVLEPYENILFLKCCVKQSDFQNSADMIAQDEVQSWTFVNKIENLRFHKT
jgi:hypothetical protein